MAPGVDSAKEMQRYTSSSRTIYYGQYHLYSTNLERSLCKPLLEAVHETHVYVSKFLLLLLLLLLLLPP